MTTHDRMAEHDEEFSAADATAVSEALAGGQATAGGQEETDGSQTEDSASVEDDVDALLAELTGREPRKGEPQSWEDPALAGAMAAGPPSWLGWRWREIPVRCTGRAGGSASVGRLARRRIQPAAAGGPGVLVPPLEHHR